MILSPRDYQVLEQIFLYDEGCRLEPYLDSKGLPTIGIGHLITAQTPNPKGPWTYEQCFEQLRKDIDKHCNDADRLWGVPFCNSLSLPRKAAVLSLTFTLGYTKLKTQFFQTVPAIARKEWGRAANLLMLSKWAKDIDPKQRPNVGRDDRVTYMMRFDKFPDAYKIKG